MIECQYCRQPCDKIYGKIPIVTIGDKMEECGKILGYYESCETCCKKYGTMIELPITINVDSLKIIPQQADYILHGTIK